MLDVFGRDDLSRCLADYVAAELNQTFVDLLCKYFLYFVQPLFHGRVEVVFDGVVRPPDEIPLDFAPSLIEILALGKD